MNPYRDYMNRAYQEKQALDFGAIADGVQHLAHHPAIQGLGHAGIGAAIGHIGANVVSNVKNHIPAARQALTNAGVRAGLAGKELNPMIDRFAANILGPEFVGKEFGIAKNQASKALQAAGGDKHQALEALRAKATDPKSQNVSKMLGFEHTNEALGKLPDNLLSKQPSKLLYVDKDAPHLEARRRFADIASVVAAGKADIGAGASVAWNKFKEVAFTNPKLRERMKGTPLDVSRATAHEISDGMMQGRRNPLQRAFRKLVISPESETFREMGHQIGHGIPDPKLKALGRARPMASIEHDPELHNQLFSTKSRLAGYLKSEKGRDMADSFLAKAREAI